MMHTLRIEHTISSFDGWKKAFDSDPINRKKMGVKRYRIFRSLGNPNLIVIELDFDTLEEAEATQTALKNLFPQIEGKLIFDVQMKLLNLIQETNLE